MTPKTQVCDVCGGVGYWSGERIELASHEVNGPPRIAQCGRCHRFICEDHGEVVRLSGAGVRVRFGGTRTLCCPFDPDVPLGT